MLLSGAFLYLLLLYIYYGREPVISHFVPRIPIFFIGYRLAECWKPSLEFKKNISDLIGLLIVYTFSMIYLPGYFFNAGVAISLLFILSLLSRFPIINDSLYWVGTYSFDVYLVHDQVLRYLSHWIGELGPEFLRPFVFLTVGLLCTVVTAMLFSVLGSRVVKYMHRIL